MFLKSGSSFLNVDRAVKAEPGPASRGVETVMLRDERGVEIGIVRTLDLQRVTAPTVAGTPLSAAFVSHTGSVRWATVIAWRLMPNGEVEPVVAGERPTGTMFLRDNDGTLVGMGQRFATLDEAIAAIVQAAQESQQ